MAVRVSSMVDIRGCMCREQRMFQDPWLCAQATFDFKGGLSFDGQDLLLFLPDPVRFSQDRSTFVPDLLRLVQDQLFVSRSIVVSFEFRFVAVKPVNVRVLLFEV